MSSHHIVREKQEPALLILGMGNFLPEHLGQLLEWSPTVIATAETFDLLNSEGIKVDWLISENPLTDMQNDVRFIPCGTCNYAGAALNALIEKDYGAVNIIIDPNNDLVIEDYSHEINIVIYLGNQKTFPIRSGYQKWMPAGEIIRIKDPGLKLITNGLNKVDQYDYETIANGIITLQFAGDYLFITEFL